MKVKIDGKNYECSVKGKCFLIYREEFGQDLYLKVNEAIANIAEGKTILDAYGIETLENLVVASIKAGGKKKIDKSFIETVDQYGDVVEAGVQIADALLFSVLPALKNVETENSEEAPEAKKKAEK